MTLEEIVADAKAVPANFHDLFISFAEIATALEEACGRRVYIGVEPADLAKMSYGPGYTIKFESEGLGNAA